jgi:hypothetical protein
MYTLLVYVPFIIRIIYAHITGYTQKYVLFGRFKGVSMVILTIRDSGLTRHCIVIIQDHNTAMLHYLCFRI